METKNNILLIIVVVMGAFLFGVSSILHAEVVQEFSTDTGTGKVDWEGGYIYGTAIGTAKMGEMVNKVQAEQVAKTTARHLAYMVLLETLNKVNISAKSLYQKQIMEDSILKVETQGILQNAHVWKEEFSWTPEGSPRAVVTVRIPIYDGHLSKVAAGWAERQQAKEPQLPKFEPKEQEVKKVEPVAKKYTGLIIDARGKGVEPTMVPRILTSDGNREVYGPRMVNRNSAILTGYAGYARSVEMAKKNDRIGFNPLIVKAERAEGNRSGDIVVSEDDAIRILAADIKGKFLKDCKVVIVVD